MRDTIEIVVVGAGVIGLAIARAFARSGHEVIVLERNPRIGEEISARNSEVIHAGIYYPTGSLKATHCVRGKEKLYRYCTKKGISHNRCGKIIVSTQNDQQSGLKALHDQAIANGITDLQWLSRSEVEKLEPSIQCVEGLLSPSTGIIDSHSFMLALQADLETANGSVAILSELVRAKVTDRGLQLAVKIDNQEFELTANTLINSAGLYASQVANKIEGLLAQSIFRTYYAKGNYFTHDGPSPFSRLIYPLPEDAGLGVHATLDLANQARFGPDVQWVDNIDYTIDEERIDKFYTAVRKYWPELPGGSLSPDYAGIRPKIVAEGEPPGDFVIQGPKKHGVPGLVNLYGIESPGLTAALAIADHVTALLEKR